MTTTAPQALALINSDLVYSWSQVLAGRVIREAGRRTASAWSGCSRSCIRVNRPRGNEDAAGVPRQPGKAARGPARGRQADRGAGRLRREPAGRRRGRQAVPDAVRPQPDRYEKVALVSFAEKQQKAARPSRQKRTPEPAPAEPTRMRRAPRPSSTWRMRSRTRTNSAIASNYYSPGNHFHESQDISQGTPDRRRTRCRRRGAQCAGCRAACSRPRLLTTSSTRWRRSSRISRPR